MRMYQRVTLAFITAGVVAVGAAGSCLAGEPQHNVVGDQEIQATIDQHVGQADADRLAIQVLLQREDVSRIAGSAGLDLERASAAAAVLSGPDLERLAAQARGINEGFAGGDGTVVLSTTAIIIILLILILLVN